MCFWLPLKPRKQSYAYYNTSSRSSSTSDHSTTSTTTTTTTPHDHDVQYKVIRSHGHTPSGRVTEKRIVSVTRARGVPEDLSQTVSVRTHPKSVSSNRGGSNNKTQTTTTTREKRRVSTTGPVRYYTHGKPIITYD